MHTRRRGLKKTLLATGNAILAEATKNDRNWGIGLNLDHPDLASPRKWQGANILGWSLMEAGRRAAAGGPGGCLVILPSSGTPLAPGDRRLRNRA